MSLPRTKDGDRRRKGPPEPVHPRLSGGPAAFKHAPPPDAIEYPAQPRADTGRSARPLLYPCLRLDQQSGFVSVATRGGFSPRFLDLRRRHGVACGWYRAH